MAAASVGATAPCDALTSSWDEEQGAPTAELPLGGLSGKGGQAGQINSNQMTFASLENSLSAHSARQLPSPSVSLLRQQPPGVDSLLEATAHSQRNFSTNGHNWDIEGQTGMTSCLAGSLKVSSDELKVETPPPAAMSSHSESQVLTQASGVSRNIDELSLKMVDSLTAPRGQSNKGAVNADYVSLRDLQGQPRQQLRADDMPRVSGGECSLAESTLDKFSDTCPQTSNSESSFGHEGCCVASSPAIRPGSLNSHEHGLVMPPLTYAHPDSSMSVRNHERLSLPRLADGLSSDENGDDDDEEKDENGSGAASLQERKCTVRGRHDNDADAHSFFSAHERRMQIKTEDEREAVKAIIDDIRKALASREQAAARRMMSAEAEQGHDNDNVWLVRDSYSDKLRRQDEMRAVRIEMEKRYEEEFRQKQMDEVYHMEHDEDKLLSSQPQATDMDDDVGSNNVLAQGAPGRSATQRLGLGLTSLAGDDYDEHDRDIAGSWFTSKSKYERVLHDDSSSVDSSSEISGSYTAAAAASSSSTRRQASTYLCHAARLADHGASRNGTKASSPTSPNDGDVTVANGHEMTAASSRRCQKNGRSPITDENEQCAARQPSLGVPLVAATTATALARLQPRHNSGDGSASEASDFDEGSDEDIRQRMPLGQHGDYDTDDETDKLMQNEYKHPEGSVRMPEREDEEMRRLAKKNKAKEVAVYHPDDPTVLIEGILFRASYLGSTQLLSEMQPSKAMRMMQAQEAVGRIKAPEGESQPSTDVDLFVSTEKVMVLNTDLKEIIMDHSLRSISYIADIESVLIVMAKRNVITSPGDDTCKKQQKLICHVFETDEAQLIAKSIGQAFQVAYMEFLKANGIDDPGLLKETTYEDILGQQEIAHDELDTFTRRDMQKEVVVPKAKGEALGVVIVESGWGSMLPTVVLANMSATGPATRCGQLSIGDQVMALNGVSLVGLPLSTCQDQIKAQKSQTFVKLTVVSRPPVVDVLIKRPDIKYQLGFSVQNGVICSLLRGGIAERGGIRVGHRIIEINGHSVVATAHEKIVYTLSTSVGEIRMKTMPMSIFRLLTGQEAPHYI